MDKHVSPRFMQLVDEMKDLYERKNAGYSGMGETDPFRNFRYARLFGVSPFVGCLIRISDKFIRISNLIKDTRNEKVGESIVDTLRDLAVYCIIAICLYEEEADPNKKEDCNVPMSTTGSVSFKDYPSYTNTAGNKHG